jgi:hypothetical protein
MFISYIFSFFKSHQKTNSSTTIINLFIVDIQNKSTSLSINIKNTITDLKQQTLTKLKIHYRNISDFYLSFNGKILKENNTIDDSMIENDCNIRLHVRLKEGTSFT